MFAPNRSHFAPLVPLCLLVCLFTCQPKSLQGQGLGVGKNYPSLGYYAAHSLLHDGQLDEAALSYRESLRSAYQVGNTRWIDSVPAIVMIGECNYQQGNLVSALEQYELALTIVMQNGGWTSRIQDASTVQARTPADARGIQWGVNSRGTQIPLLPGTLPVMLGNLNNQNVLQTGGVVLPPELVQVDVTEIQRTIAWALYRRNAILGPLAANSPLTPQIVDALQAERVPNFPTVVAGHSVCLALARLGTSSSTEAVQLLASNISIGGQADHPLTPIALLAYSRVLTSQGKAAISKPLLIDATLVSAQLNQLDSLNESCIELGHTGVITRDSNVADTLKAIATWSQRNSRLAQASSLVHAAEVAGSTGNLTAADTMAKAGATAVRGRGIYLPRVTSQSAYALAIVDFSQGKTASGMQALQSALSLYRGTTQTGTGSKVAFQTMTTVDLYQRGQLDERDAEKLLDTLLINNVPATVLAEPLEGLAQVSTNQQLAWTIWLGLKERSAKTEELLVFIDRYQRQRFYDTQPLSHRLLTLRWMLHADPNTLPVKAAKGLDLLRAAFPAITNQATEIRQQTLAMKQQPLGWDKAALSKDSIAAWGKLLKSVQNQEAFLHLLAVSRVTLEPVAPLTLDLVALQKSMGDQGCVIAFQVLPNEKGTKLVGYAITSKEVKTWDIANPAQIDLQIAKLLTQMGLGRGKRQVPMDLKSYQTTCKEILDALIPAEQQTELNEKVQRVIVPTQSLWYLPFGLLPSGEAEDGATWSEQYELAFAPTLGTAAMGWQAPPKPLDAVLWNQRFFAPKDEEQELAMSKELVESFPKMLKLEAPRELAPLNLWRARPSMAIVANVAPRAADPLATPWLVIDKPKSAMSLADVSVLPLKLPDAFFLPGWSSGAADLTLGSGDDLFIPACSLVASGGRQVLLSRWPVGGASGQQLLKGYCDEIPESSPADSWRRSLIALWAEELAVTSEPVLTGIEHGQTKLKGDHPIFWSGYLPIGAWFEAPEAPLGAPEEPPADAPKPDPAAPDADAPDADPMAANPVDGAPMDDDMAKEKAEEQDDDEMPKDDKPAEVKPADKDDPPAGKAKDPKEKAAPKKPVKKPAKNSK